VCWQYNFYLDKGEFVQEGTEQEPIIYWLDVQAYPADPCAFFGWKTADPQIQPQFMDDAVWALGEDDPCFLPQWNELSYPEGHLYYPESINLAFVITGDVTTEPDLDFGDANDPTYPTLLPGGASHVILGPWLGDLTDGPDAEGNGQPDATATGDDLDGNDDEDGVNIPILVQGKTDQITFEVNGAPAGGAGAWVKMWLDWNGDGIWQDPAEVIEDNWYTDGVYSVSVTPTYNSVIGQTFLRARISTQSGLGVGGPASDGEVEDHKVIIEEGPELIPKFRQLPLNGPRYFGHDELSTAYQAFDQQGLPLGYEGCYMADDFADPYSGDVVRVRWWGSYMEDVYEQPVNRFLIVFETDVPADPAGGNPYSHPGEVILTQEVWRGAPDPLALSPGEFSEVLIGPGGPPCGEDLYEYEAFLKIPFHQEPHTVYWIKIVALVDIAPPEWWALEAAAAGLTGGLCELLNMPWNVIFETTDVSVVRWGWHNRDYTIKDVYASTAPAVVPGEHLAGNITDPCGLVDMEIWHFQDDAVSGPVEVVYSPDSEDPNVYQDEYFAENYKYSSPLCPDATRGVDGPGPEGEGIDIYSKDLAFELKTEACFPSGHVDYPMWVKALYPSCWCCQFQCRGDADCGFTGKDKNGKRQYVSLPDLTIFNAGWLKFETDPAFSTFICADFNHGFDGKDKTGKRQYVSLPDLTIFNAGWLKPETVPHFTPPCF
jgi:hypothetical protein